MSVNLLFYIYKWGYAVVGSSDTARPTKCGLLEIENAQNVEIVCMTGFELLSNMKAPKYLYFKHCKLLSEV